MILYIIKNRKFFQNTKIYLICQQIRNKIRIMNKVWCNLHNIRDQMYTLHFPDFFELQLPTFNAIVVTDRWHVLHFCTIPHGNLFNLLLLNKLIVFGRRTIASPLPVAMLHKRRMAALSRDTLRLQHVFWKLY